MPNPQSIRERFRLDASGRIQNPGKFEGELVYVAYYWECFLEGMADRDDGKVLGFDIQGEDREVFPELGDSKRTVRIMERDDGKVVEV